jgi:septal ring factor EnvC (AmiA/AmiB activator)
MNKNYLTAEIQTCEDNINSFNDRKKMAYDIITKSKQTIIAWEHEIIRSDEYIAQYSKRLVEAKKNLELLDSQKSCHVNGNFGLNK